VWKPLCFCSKVITRKLPIPTHLMINVSEYHRTTNTGRLLSQLYPDVNTVLRGDPENHLSLFDIVPEVKIPLVMFPSDDAIDLPIEPDSRHQLVILDGNWSQGKKMANRWKQHPRTRLVKLPNLPTWGVYNLRKNPDPARICTFEAAIKAISYWDHSMDIQYTTKFLHNFVQSILWMNGRLGPNTDLPSMTI
ncbi:DTW domain-containing protein, partial [Bacteriovoracaceae bacterium]|nr:DTW domain-containing protein [Bacteriovoracaceae bacterium]